MARTITAIPMITPVTMTILMAIATTTRTITRLQGIGTMSDAALAPASLIRLQSWLSPSFPVGSFSYSHGLESAVEAGSVADEASLRDWLEALVSFGSGWNDAVFFAEAWRRARSGDVVDEVTELGVALAGSQERHTETTLQGAAFIAAASKGWPHPALEKLPEPCPYAVAVGAFAGVHALPLEPSLAAFLLAFAANLAQGAIRLGVTGQSGVVGVIAALESIVIDTARHAAASDLDDLGSATVLSEIMSMRHETHYSRLFRT
jgi:urease accessory protein